MPVFEYKGIDGNSKNVSGTLDADSEKAARAKLRKMKIFPTKVSPEGSGSFLKKLQLGGITVEVIASMTRQISVLLEASIPLIDSLEATIEQTENQEVRKALLDIKEKVSEGGRLGESMEAYPRIFDNVYINMVKAGEAGGNLDQVLSSVADFKEAQAELKSKVQGAMIYPLFMLATAVIMVVYLFVNVVPDIAKVISKKGAALPIYTQMTLSLSNFLIDYWWMALVMVVTAVVLVLKWRTSASGRKALDALSLRLPGLNTFTKKVAVARFARTLSTLLSTGVQLLPALEITKKVLDNQVMAEKLDKVIEQVREGENLNEPLRRTGLFPGMFVHMVRIGEKTGELEAMLARVATTFEKEVDGAVKGLTALMTPVMLVFMGLVIGFVVMSVMTPILDAMKF